MWALRPGALRSADRRRRTGRSGRCRLRSLRRARRRPRRGRRPRRTGRHARRGSRTTSASRAAVAGSELARSAMLQAVKFGVRLVSPRSVTGLSRGPDGFRVRLDDQNDVAARAVVIASGVQYRRLGRPQVSPTSKVAASTTPRPKSRRGPASARTRSWWEAPTRRASRPVPRPSRPIRSTSSSAATTSPRPCRATSPSGSPIMNGSLSTLGHS